MKFPFQALLLVLSLPSMAQPPTDFETKVGFTAGSGSNRQDFDSHKIIHGKVNGNEAFSLIYNKSTRYLDRYNYGLDLVLVDMNAKVKTWNEANEKCKTLARSTRKPWRLIGGDEFKNLMYLENLNKLPGLGVSNVESDFGLGLLAFWPNESPGIPFADTKQIAVQPYAYLQSEKDPPELTPNLFFLNFDDIKNLPSDVISIAATADTPFEKEGDVFGIEQFDHMKTLMKNPPEIFGKLMGQKSKELKKINEKLKAYLETIKDGLPVFCTIGSNDFESSEANKSAASAGPQGGATSNGAFRLRKAQKGWPRVNPKNSNQKYNPTTR